MEVWGMCLFMPKPGPHKHRAVRGTEKIYRDAGPCESDPVSGFQRLFGRNTLVFVSFPHKSYNSYILVIMHIFKVCKSYKCWQTQVNTYICSSCYQIYKAFLMPLLSWLINLLDAHLGMWFRSLCKLVCNGCRRGEVGNVCHHIPAWVSLMLP